MLEFIIGLAVGTVVGMAVMCVLVVGERGDVQDASPSGNYTENKEVMENDSPVETKE